MKGKTQASNIKVAVRIRPVLPDELAKGLIADKNKLSLDNRVVKIYNEKHSNYKNYKFDQCFDENSDQGQVFRRSRIDYLVKQVVAGFHSTVFVYGQTGSGKTHTMEGYKYEPALTANNQTILVPKIIKPGEVPENTDPYSLNLPEEGLIPRSIRELFEQVNLRKQNTNNNNITIQIQYVQLYNEKVYDLLNSQAIRVMGKATLSGIPGLKVKWNPQTDDVIIENAFEFECKTPEDALKYFWKGLKNKMMASHAMNNQSSRSHCILSFRVTQIDTQNAENTIVSKLQLVDLAGSERQSATQGFGGGGQDSTFQKEAIEINKSLFTLRQVISALEQNSNFSGVSHQQYVPYRESKLTTLLRNSLGGNSYCLMVACLAPLDKYYEENISTLQYASKATAIANAPKINIDPKVRQIIDQKSFIEKLTTELQKANDYIRFLTQGGCICKMGQDGTQQNLNSITGPASQIGLQQAQNFMKSNGSESSNGVTINNNFNQSTIRIINGDSTTSTVNEGLQLSGQTQSQPNIVPQQTLQQQSAMQQSQPLFQVSKPRNASRMSSRTKMSENTVRPTQKSESVDVNSKNKTTKVPLTGIIRSNVDEEENSYVEKFPLLPKPQKTERVPRGLTPSRNTSIAKTQITTNKQQNAQVSSNAYLAAKQRQHAEKMKQHQTRMIQHKEQAQEASQEFTTSRKKLMNTTTMTSMSAAKFYQQPSQNSGSKVGSQITASNFSAITVSQQQDGLHGLSQDRMIHSIGIVKEVLQSNMQLRDDLLNLTQEQQTTSTENFQLNIENEDLRDRLNLLSSKQGVSISYNNYLPGVNIDEVMENVDSDPGIKNQLFNYIFSMRKDNRNLMKRIQSFEKDDQGRRERARLYVQPAVEYQQVDQYTNLIPTQQPSQNKSTISYQQIQKPPPTPEMSVPSSTGGKSDVNSNQQKMLKKLQQQKKRPSRTQIGTFQEESLKAEAITLHATYNPDIKRAPSSNGRRTRQETKIPTSRLSNGNKSRQLKETAQSVDDKAFKQKNQKTSLIQSPERKLRINTITEEDDEIHFYQRPVESQTSPTSDNSTPPVISKTNQNTASKVRSSMEKIKVDALRNSIQSDNITNFK